MSNTKRRAIFGGLATIATAALLAGCASAPAASTSAPTASAIAGFKPCMVSDLGGFDDKSFNQLGYEGLNAAAASLGVKAITVQSNAETDYAPNLDSLISQNCTLIVTVGFALSAATVTAALANPTVNFAIIDDAADNNFDGKTDAPNIKPILFNTAQAAFLAGYASASYSKAGKVATWGGMNFPTVTIFMDGFAQGVDYFNKQKSKSVQVLGYDEANPSAATFTGGFEANDTAKTTAANFIDQGADVLLPVGGPIFQSAGAAITDSGKSVALLGADADVFDTFPTYDSLYFTSVLKGIKQATSDVVTQAGTKSTFDVTSYIGDLSNNGVGIAPFHNFQSKVDSGLQGELDTIKAGIISGSIPVKSYLVTK
ncbi:MULTISPECIES: BMP family lipoprotein [Subtercola]|uniref:BMP family ABC transporter substrate-binding protein n=1 Tax=Subtercola vilae TaxID=2056433 RepID=A0A4V6U5B4_9MICO|nr:MULTISPECIES: BMP family ABC transporter substrate-binding protein [Subtercola]MEA9984464.1 BMP family ABC transporter substrate-binding protein [Subtercola sp. RTI3]TIH33854.1 BMP family ABC transporter substrate-binding protein [Subtercola vilae]